MVEGYIFDMDGVLCDSEEFIAMAAILMFKQTYGVEVTVDDFTPFVGAGENRYIGGVAKKYGIDWNQERDKAETYRLYGECVKGNLQALPTAWKDGEFKGLVARGNFACSAEWKNGRATQITITSRSGQECTLNYPGIAKATVVDRQGTRLKVQKSGSDNIRFATEKGASYAIKF